MNTQGRKTHIDALGVEGGAAASAAAGTISGHRALLQEDAAAVRGGRPRQSHRRRPAAGAEGRGEDLNGLVRRGRDRPARPERAAGDPPLRAAEPEEPRHRPGLYPLGSCTMKHNPRLNEKLARLPGFADLHPLQPESTVQGALELMDRLAHWLKTLTGMPAVALSPRPAPTASSAACWPSARRIEAATGHGPAQARAGAELRPRHQSGDRRSSAATPWKTIPADATRPRRPRRPARRSWAPTSPRSW